MNTQYINIDFFPLQELIVIHEFLNVIIFKKFRNSYIKHVNLQLFQIKNENHFHFQFAYRRTEFNYRLKLKQNLSLRIFI